MKKGFLVISVIALIACLTGIPELAEGIAARGWGGVNYGRILFPLIGCVVSFLLYRRKN